MFLSERIHPLHVILHLFACWWQITAYHLAIHVSSHRRVFKSDVLDKWIPVFCAPFFGHSVYTYYLHHIKMHHVSDNSPLDISSTLFYQRDSLLGFLHYFFRFYFLAFFDLPRYFMKHNQRNRALIALCCEVGTFALMSFITYKFNTMAMVWCFWVPMTASRFGMMSGNWVQHAFLDPKDPLGGGLHNSITIIESRYNFLNFNDGYHASHHLNAQRHWSEHPREFLNKRQAYVDSDAIVLKGTDYDGVFGLLMSGNYKALAEMMVDIALPKSRKWMTLEEREAWLMERTKKFTWMDLDSIYGRDVLEGKFGKAAVEKGFREEGLIKME
ncbi:fatty acid desaturase-domain-containing protein [Chytriomyces sp. MP71]|nr:fatty acid desaturase-domain-containing protein [Chytriomyces sp. MP71]